MPLPFRTPKEIAPYLHYRADSLSSSTSFTDQIIGALASMDTERMDLLIDNNCFYNGVGKTDFLDQLGQLYDSFRRHGDLRLYVFPGRLPARPKVRGYRLVGNETGNHIDLIIEIANGSVTDIRECCGLTTPVYCKGRRLTLQIDNNPF